MWSCRGLGVAYPVSNPLAKTEVSLAFTPSPVSAKFSQVLNFSFNPALIKQLSGRFSLAGDRGGRAGWLGKSRSWDLVMSWVWNVWRGTWEERGMKPAEIRNLGSRDIKLWDQSVACSFFLSFLQEFQSHETASVGKEQKKEKNNEEASLCHKQKVIWKSAAFQNRTNPGCQWLFKKKKTQSNNFDLS